MVKKKKIDYFRTKQDIGSLVKHKNNVTRVSVCHTIMFAYNCKLYAQKILLLKNDKVALCKMLFS